MKLSRRGAVEPFHAMDVLAEATKRRAAGRPVISMAVGQPVHPAPEAARNAARRALEIGRIGYTDALGLLSLRTAISDFYKARHGVSVHPGRIAITTGSSAGFNLAFLALFDAGDRVGVDQLLAAGVREELLAGCKDPLRNSPGPLRGFNDMDDVRWRDLVDPHGA